MPQQRLITIAEYETMAPFAQGWIVAAQSLLDGSPLKGLTNPYEKRTPDHESWIAGHEKVRPVGVTRFGEDDKK